MRGTNRNRIVNQQLYMRRVRDPSPPPPPPPTPEPQMIIAPEFNPPDQILKQPPPPTKSQTPSKTTSRPLRKNNVKSVPTASLGPFHAFNGNPQCGVFIQNLMLNLDIQACIETGTYKGGSTLWFAKLLPEVHTIEINEDLYRENQTTFKGLQSIRAHLGNSPKVMDVILKDWDPERSVLFYLDAHWHDYWPILDELLAISRSSCRNNCVIVIDDFQIPGRPDIPYDSYNGQALNFHFVEASLRKAIPDLHYEYYAPPPSMKGHRGRLVAYPRSWKEALESLQEDKVADLLLP